jgi:hypothetical protein
MIAPDATAVLTHLPKSGMVFAPAIATEGDSGLLHRLIVNDEVWARAR